MAFAPTANIDSAGLPYMGLGATEHAAATDACRPTANTMSTCFVGKGDKYLCSASRDKSVKMWTAPESHFALLRQKKKAEMGAGVCVACISLASH